MSDCAVCGKPGAGVLELADETRVGLACPGECVGLLWEAHFLRATKAPAHEHAEVLWMWRRKRADAEGRVFLEAPPTSPTEREARRLDALAGVTR